MTPRAFKARFIALVVLPLVAACGAALSAEDRESIAKDAINIGVCQSQANSCKALEGDAAPVKCWPVYDACMQGHGLRDGGDQ